MCIKERHEVYPANMAAMLDIIHSAELNPIIATPCSGSKPTYKERLK